MTELHPLMIEAQALQLKTTLEYQRKLNARLEDKIELLESEIEQLKTIIEYLETRLGIHNSI